MPNSLINIPENNISLTDRFKQFFIPVSVSSAFARSHSRIEPAKAIPEPTLDRNNIFEAAFLKTYEFDGYDVTQNEAVAADGKTFRLPRRLTKALILTTIFGLPNRFGLDSSKHYAQSLLQIAKNYIGGWDTLPQNPKTKKINFNDLTRKQVANLIVTVIPIKPLVILPLKLVGTVLKTGLFVVKFVTELLSTILEEVSGKLAGYTFAVAGNQIRKQTLLSVVPGIVLFALSGLAFLAHSALRVVSLLARAIFSPQKNARMAWAYGIKTDSRFAPLIGIVGVALSIALTLTLWAIVLPLAINQVMMVIPQLLPLLTQLGQIPVIAASLTVINGSLATASASIAAAFSPAVTALAAIAGVKVSATALAVGSTFAVISAPLAIGLSTVADGFSNRWAKWDGVLELNVVKPVGNFHTGGKGNDSDEVPLTASDEAMHNASKLVKNDEAIGKVSEAADFTDDIADHNQPTQQTYSDSDNEDPLANSPRSRLVFGGGEPE
jgi:hypothetical protein